MKRRDFLIKSSMASSAVLVPSFMKAFENLDPTLLGYKKLVTYYTSGADALAEINPIQLG